MANAGVAAVPYFLPGGPPAPPEVRTSPAVLGFRGGPHVAPRGPVQPHQEGSR